MSKPAEPYTEEECREGSHFSQPVVLTDRLFATLAELLQHVGDPAAHFLKTPPSEDVPLSPESRASLERGTADVRAGRVKSLDMSTLAPAEGVSTLRFNINDYVYVRLTEHARRRLGSSAPETEPDGRTRFQLWHLMHDLGEQMYNGGEQLFEKNLMEIPIDTERFLERPIADAIQTALVKLREGLVSAIGTVPGASYDDELVSTVRALIAPLTDDEVQLAIERGHAERRAAQPVAASVATEHVRVSET